MRILLCSLLVLGGDQVAAGLRAYREGRYQDALAAFTAAERAFGAAAPAALHYDKALAALRAGDSSTAAAAAEQAAARGGAEFAFRRDFLRGNIALARSEAAAAQAGRAESEPFAFAAAIALAESARDAWQDVAMARQDWPHARRNAERALDWLEELQRRRAAAEATQAKKEPDAPRPRPRPEEGEPPAPRAPDELSPAQVRRLLDKLAAKEQEKLRLRRSQQRAASVEVQQDW